MWVADSWTSYALLDCSDGERLERWGDHILVRPDPQVIWRTPKRDKAWAHPDAHYIRSSTGGGHWDTYRTLPASWTMPYPALGLTFQVRPMNFKHTGLFPEQAVNWAYMIDRISAAVRTGRTVSVINLFGYTGAATVAAAKAGASVCHVDAAKGMVAWGRENAAASGLQNAPIRWIVDDCSKFVQREIRRGHHYDVILMDPPSYGRGPSGELWKLEQSLWDFLLLAVQLLSDDPLFVLINAYTTGLSASTMRYLAETVFSAQHPGHAVSEELGLPVHSSGLYLPCGCTCRWEAEPYAG